MTLSGPLLAKSVRCEALPRTAASRSPDREALGDSRRDAPEPLIVRLPLFLPGQFLQSKRRGGFCEPQRNKKRSASAAPDMTRVRLDLRLSRFAKPPSVL